MVPDRMRAAHALAIAGLFTLGACREQGTKPAEPTASAAPSPSVTAAPTATATATSNASALEPMPPTPARELTWRWKDSPVGPMVVVVSVPETAKRLPVLIAMHGLGESEKGPERGARGWLDDYALAKALERLSAPPLTNADYQRLGGEARRGEVNAVLDAHPYEGLILVMPYTPNILEPDRSLDGAEDLGRFLVKEVLPKVHAETPALTEVTSTGIDGVSLGGRAALLVGLTHPNRFGVVGSLQAAVYPHEVEELVARVKEARAQNPTQQLRLLTSSADFYRGTLGKLSRALTKDKLVHHFLVVEGPHAYAFNRGPGVYEMLVFHDRALRSPLQIDP